MKRSLFILIVTGVLVRWGLGRVAQRVAEDIVREIERADGIHWEPE